MGDFLKDYWIWIAIPIAFVAVALGALFFLAGGDETGQIIYPVF